MPSSRIRRCDGSSQRHLELNAIADRVTVSDLALADEDKDDVQLFVSCWPENDGIASLTPAAETLARGGLRADASIAVRVRTFDTWVQSARLPRIDLMKIDVEGAEAQSALGHVGDVCQPSVRSESSARRRCRARPCRILRDRGYRASTLDEIPGGIPNLLFE